MNLKKTPDKILLQQASQLARQERECLAALLHHLREIHARRLYSALRYGSIYEYIVQELKYPEDQAYRRVSAMWLLEELPEVEESIKSGSLTLTNLNYAQVLFRREKGFSREAKLDLVRSLENKSSREAQRALAKISPAPPRESVRPISETNVELQVVISNETLAKLERLKGLLAHSCPGITFGQLIDKLADEGLKAWDKTAAPRVTVRRAAAATSSELSKLSESSKPSNNTKPLKTTKTSEATTTSKNAENSRYIPRPIYRMVWQRDKSCRWCGSVYALQVDHILPQALGGTSELENLRLLCRHCNQRAAVESYGQDKMVKYLGPAQ